MRQQLKGQLHTGRTISVVKDVFVSCVLVSHEMSSAVGKQHRQRQAKSIPSFLFAGRTMEGEAFVMGAGQGSWGEMLWDATSCLQLHNFICPSFPGTDEAPPVTEGVFPVWLLKSECQEPCGAAGEGNWAEGGEAVLFTKPWVVALNTAGSWWVKVSHGDVNQ